MAEKYLTESDEKFLQGLKKLYPNAEVVELFTLECDDDHFSNLRVIERKPLGWD